MDTSVIIPTYNGARKIVNLLNFLKVQTFLNFEVIVVVDGSTDNTIEVLKKFSDSFYAFKVVQQKNGGRAVARNVGARLASGELLIFIDDDMMLNNDNVFRHHQFHATHEQTILVANPSVEKEKFLSTPFLRYRHKIESGWAEGLMRKGLFKLNFNEYFFSSANFSIPKSIFAGLKGFDEDLRDSEDFDFGIRALLEKFAIYVDGNLVVYNQDFSDLIKITERQYQYYTAKLHLLQRHPNYQALVKKHFTWLNDGGLRDKIRSVIFLQSRLWENFLQSGLVSRLPTSVRDLLFANYLYANSVLMAKREMER